MHPAAVALVGRKGSGRAEVLAFLIDRLTANGLRVGVIKHVAREDFEVDDPGKDTFEYRARGAERVVLSGKKRLAVFANTEEETPVEVLLADFQEFDLVFLDGYFHADVPKIEIHRREAGPSLARGLSGLLAVCSDHDAPAPENVPYFCIRDLEPLARFIAETVAPRPAGHL